MVPVEKRRIPAVLCHKESQWDPGDPAQLSHANTPYKLIEKHVKEGVEDAVFRNPSEIIREYPQRTEEQIAEWSFSYDIYEHMLEDAEDGDRFPFRFPATLFSFLQHNGKLIDRTDREPWCIII